MYTIALNVRSFFPAGSNSLDQESYLCTFPGAHFQIVKTMILRWPGWPGSIFMIVLISCVSLTKIYVIGGSCLKLQ